MKGIKCHLLSGFFAILLAISSVVSLGSLSVSAASPYDSSYQTIDKLMFGHPSSNFFPECPVQDVTNSFSGLLLNSDYYSEQGELWKTSFNQAVLHGSIAVSQMTNNQFNAQQIVIHWTENRDMEIRWNTDGTVEVINPHGSIHTALLRTKNYQNGNGGCNSILIPQGAANLISYPSSASEPIKNLFVDVDPSKINLPSGYSGSPVRTTVQQPKTRITPEFSYDVDNKKVQARITGQLAFRERLQIRWALQKTGEGDTIIEVKTLSPDNTYNAEVPENGQWSLYATPVNPTPLLPIPDSHSLHSKIQVINFDGSTFSSDTSHSDCSDTGEFNFCQQYSVYEDCSVYNTLGQTGWFSGSIDLIGGFGCVMGNFGTFMRSMLIAVFVPDLRFITSLYDQFTTTLTDKLGFLTFPFQFGGQLLSSISNAMSTSSQVCDLSFGNVMGGNFKLNYCSFEQQFPIQFAIFRIITIAATSFGLLSAIFNEYRRVIG